MLEVLTDTSLENPPADGWGWNLINPGLTQIQIEELREACDELACAGHMPPRTIIVKLEIKP